MDPIFLEQPKKKEEKILMYIVIHTEIFSCSTIKQDFKYASQSQCSLNYGVTSDAMVIYLVLTIELNEWVHMDVSAGTHVCIQMAFSYPPDKFWWCFQCLIN